MWNSRRSRPVCVLLAAAMLLQLAPRATGAQPAAVEPVDIQADLEHARALINTAQFDEAIRVLEHVKDQTKSTLEEQRETSMLLILSWVLLGNTIQQASPASAESNYRQARSLTEELLLSRDFRHTQPDSLAPPEMVRIFEEVRRDALGTFRIQELEPDKAIAVLGVDTLGVLPDGTARGALDVIPGSYDLVIHAEGYHDLAIPIEIAASSNVVQPAYELKKKRSKIWYVGGGLAAVAGGLAVALSVGGGSASEPESPLPGPPPPPSQ